MIKIKQVRFEGAEYIAPSWEQMGKLVFELGKQILGTGQKFDWLISIAKGGWTWSRTLADYLRLDSMASVKAKLYKGIDQTSATLILEQTLPGSVNVRNKNILLFDDVADTGKTLAAVYNYLLEAGAKSIKTATLFYKPHSVIVPNFYAYQTQAWIVFPHEIREFINLSNSNWKKRGLTKKEIYTLYQKMGLPKDQTTFFLNAK